ncbi:MAG: peptidylprolyl isomerase [Candidatus Peribacteraceae bacterium]
MHKLLLPLFVLALLILGCTPAQDAGNPEEEANALPYNGDILSGNHTVILQTSLGDISLKLDADAAPKTVTNFIALAQSGYFNGLTFHRVIPDFMIQGGDPNGNGTGGESIFGEDFEDEINAESYGLNKQKLKDAVEDELPEELAEMTVQEYLETQGYQYDSSLKSLPMKYGYIAMANRGPNTNGSQFFIIQRKDGTPWLEAKHTVFGKVTDGMDVVDAIANVERDANDLPLVPVTYTVKVVN